MSEFPSQTENRRFWILETIREHQGTVSDCLRAVLEGDYETCRMLLDALYEMDRKALMQPEGIFTGEQLARIYA